MVFFMIFLPPKAEKVTFARWRWRPYWFYSLMTPYNVKKVSHEKCISKSGITHVFFYDKITKKATRLAQITSFFLIERRLNRSWKKKHV